LLFYDNPRKEKKTLDKKSIKPEKKLQDTHTP
jgi:hypothetical protein